jgi:hypothetical protein
MSNLNYQQFIAEIAQIGSMPPEAAMPFINVLAPLISHMTTTGLGTDACLAHGCLPLPVHYYSPVPDLTDLNNRQVWTRRSNLPGIEWNMAEQLALLALIGGRFGGECNWPPAPTGDPMQYYTENNSFIFGCAAGTHCMIRYSLPGHVIEIGSGYSSLVINGALELNARDISRSCEYTIIDPYPQQFINPGLSRLNKLMGQRVETVNPVVFQQLQANDILFIDSGHTVRIGSDVNFLILEILPLLNPGVIIHFHDIPMPYEYPAAYYTNPAFRMLWTESYLLQAFLCHNNQFRILLALDCIMREHLPEFKQAFCHYDPAIYHNGSGSFWIQKRSN